MGAEKLLSTNTERKRKVPLTHHIPSDATLKPYICIPPWFNHAGCSRFNLSDRIVSHIDHKSKIDHCRLHAFVSEKLANLIDIHTIFQEMSCH